ncbi:MAG: hypothetical protein GX348_00060 [Veillonellaceae bacterium]|nr:hypothetical protein [Veillonellaceae bacterium]
MAIRVGIPRCLLFYQYGAIWEKFLRELGAQVIISGDTTRKTMDAGSELDEVCLPVKVAFGHVQELAEKVDYLFVPRMISVARGQYTCPKIIGMPDLLRMNMAGLPPIIDVNIDLRQRKRNLYKAINDIGILFGKGPLVSFYAWHKAKQLHRKELAAENGQKKVALIGHPYIIHDRQLSMDVINRLHKLQFNVVTPEMVDSQKADQAAKVLGKKLFWSYSHHMAGAALAYMQPDNKVDGIIFLTSFSCGPDALTAELVGQHAHSRGIPYMLLTVDEHTAEAGFITRLEAFTDMLRRRWALC